MTIVDFMPSLPFFPLVCSLFIFYNICSLVHTKSLLSKWERAISEHAFPTLWAVTENSRFSFPLSKHTGKFLLLLALTQTSSKQTIKTKPFPSPMISPPLDQPTESIPPAATQVIGCSMGSWTPASQQSQWGALPRSEHRHQQQSSAATQDLIYQSGKLEALHGSCQDSYPSVGRSHCQKPAVPWC